MRSRFVVAGLFAGLLVACSSSQPSGNGGSTAGTIQASTGGVVEAGGAKLTIPPGALSQDAKVTLDVRGKPTEPPSNPMQPVGPAVNVDLGGASLKAAATLELPVTDTSTDGTAVVLETRPSDADGEPLLWVHAARSAASGALRTGTVSAQSLPGRVRYDLQRAGIYAVHVVPKPSPTELAVATSLEVPFYYQAGLPWCVPTSLAMTLSYFKPLPAMASNPRFPGGFTSNFGLASLIKQAPNSGSSVLDILKAAGVPEDAYRFMRWDAELVPSDGTPSDGAYNAYVAYAALATTGVFGLTSPQPVWTSSDRQWHAFVITGVTSDGFYIDDGNARPASDWAGTHPVVTLKAYRDANCALKDKDDPGKGCDDSGAAKPDLYTVTWANDPRPETERRGSIELSHGGTVYFGGVPDVFEPSLSFKNRSGKEISRWEWDGAYPNGYFFSDEAATVAGFPYVNNLVQDTQFRYLIYRSSQMLVQFNVNDVTNAALDYDVDARLSIGGVTKAQKFSTVHVGAYDATEVDLDFGNLADLAGPITSPTAAQLEIDLQQAGALQDVKQIAFKLAPDPSDQPQVNILVPSVPTTLLKGEPFTFKGEGFDAHTLPDGRARLSWFQGATKLADGPQFSYVPSAAGTVTLLLVATGEYGAQVSASVTVNVIDPTRTPGEIVIVAPVNNASYWSPTVNQAFVDVPLVGYATYSNGAAVPGQRLVWSAQPEGGAEQEVGRGSSITVPILGGQDVALRYTIRLTVLSDGGGGTDGPPIGSTTVSITVGYTHIG